MPPGKSPSVIADSAFSRSQGQKATSAGDRTTSDLPPGTDIGDGDGDGDVRFVPILLKKSKIEPHRKSRER
jgi:hypothetical protein